MSNVWGRGGLFEQALANKLALQDSQRVENMANADVMRQNASTNAFNADTTRLDSDRRFDLGLRSNLTERMNADTSRFSAETQRVDAMNRSVLGNPNQRTIGELGLRTFGASTTPLPGTGTQPLTTSRPSILSSRQSNGTPMFSDRPQGFKKGGVVMKPKMKQPGYKNGGKIEMPKEQKAGGKIGDARKDDGQDTVDVKAREGEYFLNPETVAHIGGGDYSTGVRNLNALVREATGKEPGPSPVGKSGKQGFADSGVVDPNTEFFRRAALDKTAAAKAAARQPAAAPTTMFVNSAGQASTTLPTAASQADSVRAAVSGRHTTSIGDALRGGASKATSGGASVGKKVADVAQRFGPDVLRGTVAAAGIEGAIRGLGTDTQDYYTRTGINPEATVVPQVMKDLGVRSLGVLSDVGAAALDSAALVPNLVRHGLDTDQWWSARNRFADVQQNRQQAANPVAAGAAGTAAGAAAAAAGAAPAQRDFDAEVRAKLAESEARAAQQNRPQSMRDMMLQRYATLNNELGQLAPDDQGGMIARLNQMKQLESGLTELEGRMAAGSSSAASSAAKARENADKRIDNRAQSPKFDDEGRITGYFQDPAKATELRNYLARLRDPETDQPVDFYALPENRQDVILEDFDRRYGMQQRLNQRLMENGVGLVSDSPRVGDQALRIARNQDGSMRNIGLGDVFTEEGVTIGDWMTSFGRDQLEKRLVQDPVTGKLVPARHIVGNDHTAYGELLKAAGLRTPPNQ